MIWWFIVIISCYIWIWWFIGCYIYVVSFSCKLIVFFVAPSPLSPSINLTGDVMRNKWSVGSILAIDVGCQYETQFTNYGDCLSGWSVLIRRVFPFKYFFRKELKVSIFMCLFFDSCLMWIDVGRIWRTECICAFMLCL